MEKGNTLSEWGGFLLGAAQDCAPGESVCGDSWTVVPSGEWLDLCVADGLGHGPDAAEAATRFTAACAELPGAPLEQLFVHSQERLAATRGAAAAVLRLHRESDAIAFAAVGNIDIRTRGTVDFHPASMPGIVGRRAPPVRVYAGHAPAGAVLVLHSDGISPRFDLSRFDPQSAPSALAESLLREHRVTRDDATCLVIRRR